MKYAYQQGFEREQVQELVKSNFTDCYGFVEMTDGRIFIYNSPKKFNDKTGPHYVVLTCAKTGVRFNVNLNNGIAYRTHI